MNEGAAYDNTDAIDSMIETVDNALPRDLLKKWDYEPIGGKGDRHGAIQWAWHKHDEDSSIHRTVSLAVLPTFDGAIDCVEFWIGATAGRRFARKCVLSRPVNPYSLDQELHDMMQLAIERANLLSSTDLENERPFDTVDM
ncbi:hypothetical protein [Kitasatospora griseola]|uniref:hypothetical protein n=1 Tax=Kitasatospora griseola TaxID=2064 RepID=UPI00166FCBC8|nr:hypothetical protein [Kitasatospora griseola]GGQ80406.1 hypothetical protein GCM10010195_40110 [Kitasatospora griseola]